MELQQGHIVWVRMQDQAGRNPKCRPAVVLTATDEIIPNESIVVVAATTRFTEPLPDHKIILPWKPGRHPMTGLYKPCVAVCDWLAEVSQSDIQSVGGKVSTHIMEAITFQVCRLLDE